MEDFSMWTGGQHDVLDDALDRAIERSLQDPVFLAKLLVRKLASLPSSAPARVAATRLVGILEAGLN